MNRAGPITSALEHEIKGELRRRGIVVWLDKSASYTRYVDELVERRREKEFPYPVIPFRGSYLEMILAAGRLGDGVDQEPLLIHMPGHTEESIRETWVLEMYAAGRRFRRSLETLVREVATGRVAPDKIEAYIANHLTDLAAAETWLREETAQSGKGLEGRLQNLTPEWALDGLVGKRELLRDKIVDGRDLDILIDYLHRHAGMDAAFLEFFNGERERSFNDIREAFVAWVMCVEYVHDLTHAPHLDVLKPLRRISAPLRKTCIRLVNRLRENYPDQYATYAEITEAHLHDELEAIAPEDLGKIDTFRREEERILEAAVESLSNNEWEKALKWSRDRISAHSFWVGRNPRRKIVWTLVEDAAQWGKLLDKAGRPLKGLAGCEEALDYYTDQGWRIDAAHRRFEQRRCNLFEPKLPHHGRLLEAFDKPRRMHREWADELAGDFVGICDKEGFLPAGALQQRELYNQVVHPLVAAGRKTAYFMIDALRFEMAAELAREFQKDGAHVILKGRYCELPSITSVGMNALAPLSRSGKLTLAGEKGFTGFKTGEYTVRGPGDRVRAMGERSVDAGGAGRKRARGFTLAEINDRPAASLKKSLANADLIVVRGKEIDAAGEADVGLAGFETLLRQIKSAWSHLNAVGVDEFVITADHGFLLQDNTTREKPYGSKRDPNRRYVFSKEPRAEKGATRVSLNALGYEGREGFLLFRRDTAVFATGKHGATFVHGGASLQERVIPVLTVSHASRGVVGKAEYRLTITPMEEIDGIQRVGVGIESARQLLLDFEAAQTVTLALRAPNRPDVRVAIKDAPGSRTLNQTFQLEVGKEPAEILFDLSGPRDERVRLEVFHPDKVENIAPEIVNAYFNVSGAAGDPAARAADAPSDQAWRDNFEDDAVKRVFIHLYKHGSVTETELYSILGSPRKARRFSLAFEEYADKVPFSVKIETGGGGKRYKKSDL